MGTSHKFSKGLLHSDILLVDDDIDEHIILESALADTGYTRPLLSFYSAPKAIDYLNRTSSSDFPSLIISDYQMPLMSGKEFLIYIKSTYRFSDIPVIIFSTMITENMRNDLMRSGAIACLKKTSSLNELIEMLDNLNLPQ